MLGIPALLALIGLLIMIISLFLLVTRKHKNLAIASFITGLLLIFLPRTLAYLFLN
ncbi:MAG: hypothetical protein ACM3XO_07825 [Bacteroidota bacterium]